MKLSVLITLSLVSLGNLLASDLQQMADSLQVKAPSAGDKKLALPRVKGAKIRLLGADYEQIIDKKGKIRFPMSDTAVRLSFELSKDGKKAISRDYEITVPGQARNNADGNPKPQIIPELLSWSGGQGACVLPKQILVAGDAPFCAEFIRELQAVLPKGYTVSVAEQAENAHIKFTRLKGKDSEAYTLRIDDKSVSISSKGDTGLFWGSRTLLQMLVQNPTQLPCGTAWDAPRYQLRGFMLDVGRLPIPMDYIKDVVRLMSWYKMNDLQLHLNDNYIFHEHYVKNGEDPFKKSYSAFRMESKVRGADGTPLTAQDLSYSKAEFRKLVKFANERGVNIVPEFDAPGHALSFTRVRPDLIYQGEMRHVERRCEMLDAANPKTLAFMSKVWDEYLQGQNPVFGDCPVVHVGSDEFFGAAEDYRRFTDGLLKHILSRNHTPRFWGSLKAKPGKTPVQATGVQMNLWSQDWSNAWQSVNAGYDVITTFDRDLYVVPFAGYYRADNNRRGLYENWIPNRFGRETLPAGHPQLLGAAFAVWNDEIDRLHKGYGAIDIWDSIEGLVNVLSQKMWGQPQAPRSFEEHDALVSQISRIPFCNPLSQNEKRIKLSPESLPMQIKKGSKGPDYHLTMELEMTAAPEAGKEQVLLESSHGQLLAAGKDGRVTLRRSDTIEFAYNTKLPVGQRVTLELIGSMGKTELLINGVSAGEPENVRFPLHQKDRMSTFVLPLETLGSSFTGKVYSLRVE
ncbi:MAG: family 20 glycosylhydrolase [Akkermansia sp.]|nr:family 20 glycosylhydrolase [Akkermansia sp.]